jgi:hypothetical protein
MASRSLFEAGKKGLRVDRDVMSRAQDYFVNGQKTPGPGTTPRTGTKPVAGSRLLPATPAGEPGQHAGVELYKDAQALEQLSRTEEDRRKNSAAISAINGKLSSARFVDGYGSIGGEEFFSYLNISDGLRRSGGKEWSEWYSTISHKILKMQNEDGSWAGHHCITGRCAVTSAAILNLTADREY